MSRLKDYIIQELQDVIALKQLNDEFIPILENQTIEDLADSILFEWKELGDPSEDLDQMIKWNLEQHIIHA